MVWTAKTTEEFKNGNNSNKDFTFNFPYLQTEDVKVQLLTNGLWVDNTAWTFKEDNEITFTTAPPTGTGNVRIYRDTEVDTAKAVYAAGSSVRAKDLNDNQDQALYVAQEIQFNKILTDDIRDGVITSDKLADNIDIAGTLDVTSTTTLDSTLTVAGDTTVASDIILKADNKHLAVKNAAGTNKFLVNSATGNTTVYGYVDVATDLNVAGTTNLSGTLNANGGIACDTNKFTVADSTGNTAIAGNLDVDGATTLDGTTVDGVLDVNGSATIDNVQVNGNEIDTTSGGLTVDSASGTTTIDDKLLITAGSNSDPNDIRALDPVTSKGACGMDQYGFWAADNQSFGVGMNPDDGLDYDGEYRGDGTNSYIDAYADQNINLRTTNTGSEVRISKQVGGPVSNESSDELMIRGVADGAAELYYDGTKRVETSSTGSTLTGDTTVTGKTITSTLKLGGTDVTSSATELNILDGKTFKDTLGGQTLDTTSDTEICSAKIINARIVAVADSVGGFKAIADKDNFPTSHPDLNNNAGTVISISDAAGISVNSSGVGSLATRAGGSDAVIINGFPSAMRGGVTHGPADRQVVNADPYIIPSGVGLLVQTTTTEHTYDYHKVQPTESDIVTLNDTVEDFQARYRLGTSNPNSGNHEGDLFFNKSTNKMLVYNGSAWVDISVTGNFFQTTTTSKGSNSDTPKGGSASFNSEAQKFGLNLSSDQLPESPYQLIISVNGVIQKPNAGTSVPAEGFAWDAASETLTFATAIATGTPYFITVCGSNVNTANIANNSVTLGHLEDGTSSNNGKFLRANNGADPSWETVANAAGSNYQFQYNNGGTAFGGTACMFYDHDGNLSGTGYPNTDAGDIVFKSDDEVEYTYYDKSHGNWRNSDRVGSIFGNDSDMVIYHWTDDKNYISSYNGRELRIDNAEDNEDMIKAIPGSSVALYENGNISLSTTLGGSINWGQAAVGGGVTFMEGSDNGTHHFTLYGPASIASSFWLVMPGAAPGTGKYLKSGSSTATNLEWGDADASPTTAQGDIIFRGASADERLAKGTAGQVLKMNSGATAPEWGAASSGTITALNNQAANRLTTIGASTTELDGEANLTFDGSTLAVTGNQTVSTTLAATGQITGRGFECPATVTDDWAIAAGNNAMFPGPMTVAANKTVTVPANRTLTIV